MAVKSNIERAGCTMSDLVKVRQLLDMLYLPARPVLSEGGSKTISFQSFSSLYLSSFTTFSTLSLT